jgi:hypothetical protein
MPDMTGTVNCLSLSEIAGFVMIEDAAGDREAFILWFDPGGGSGLGVILKHFSGRIVQSVNNVIEQFLGNVSEISPFGKVSPKQSIGIFVAPPLPGTVRVALPQKPFRTTVCGVKRDGLVHHSLWFLDFLQRCSNPGENSGPDSDTRACAAARN